MHQQILAHQFFALRSRRCDKCLLCPKSEYHACLLAHSLLWPVIRLVADTSRKTIPYSIPRYVPLSNDLFQPVLWSASVVHGSSMSYMARSSKVAVFLMSKAAEAVGVKGICSVGSVGKGTFKPTLYADVSGSSLCSLRTNHTPTWILVPLVGKVLSGSPCELYVSGFVWTSSKKTLHIRHQLPDVPFRPQARHSVFAFSSLSRRRRSSNDRCDGQTRYLPLPLPLPMPLALPFPLPFSFPKEK